MLLLRIRTYFDLRWLLFVFSGYAERYGILFEGNKQCGLVHFNLLNNDTFLPSPMHESTIASYSLPYQWIPIIPDDQ